MQADSLVAEIKKTGAKRVMIQVPAGLKIKLAEIIASLKENGIVALASVSPSYGACDLADEEAKQHRCELLVHIGHSKFYRDFTTAVPILYLGSGKFHPLGLKNKKTYILNVEKMSIENADRTEIEKRRYANIYNAKDAKTFAILTTTKKGQFELLAKAEEIRKRLEENDRNAFILIMHEINDDALAGVRADDFVNTACPRIVEDHFSKPILNPDDLREVLGQI